MTNNGREAIAENLDDYLIGLDDTFAFKCRGCGKCCKNREDILLNTKDLYNIAKKLNLTMRQAIQTYGEYYIGDSSHIPIVRLKPKGVNKACPLLKGSRCTVHDSKPGVCALYPLGRVAMLENEEKELSRDNPTQVKYIKNKALPCAVSRKQTVRNWLERFNLPVEDSFFIKWTETIFSISTIVKKFIDRKFPSELLDAMFNGIYLALYVLYDTDKEFMPQFLENASQILQLLAESEAKFLGAA